MGKGNKKRVQILGQELRFLSDLGADFIFAPASAKEPLRAVGKGCPEAIIQALNEKIIRCQLCPLAAGRTNAVPGEGPCETSLMFVGEAPGADEDIQGRPFVGKAGQMLTRIIGAMKFSREGVYITNVVKCRPPQNRTPQREEIEKCRPYLLAQIEAIAPRVIVALGKVAADFFHPSTAGMTSRRGNFEDYGRILVMPTFHPSYLIRNEGNQDIKKLVWKDMKKVMAVLGKK